MKTYSLRLPEGDTETLRAYFEDKDLSLSSSVRLWLIERMDTERLR